MNSDDFPASEPISSRASAGAATTAGSSSIGRHCQ